MAILFVACLAIAGPSFADRGHRDGERERGQRVVVSPKNMKGWVFQQEVPVGNGHMVYGPGRPPLGRGSAQLEVDNTGREILAKYAYQGVYLRDVTRLSYWTYRQHGLPPFAISLQFDIDPDLNDGNDSYQGRLAYEPYYTHPVLTGVWQRWNTQDNAQPGNWWFSRPPQNTPVVGCSQADPCTWSELLQKFPNVGIHRVFGRVILRAGGPWLGGFVGNTDALAIGVRGRTTIYDFEPRGRGGDHDDDEDDDDADDDD